MLTISIINVTIELVCLAISVSFFIGLMLSKSYKTGLTRMLLRLLLIGSAYMLADAAAWAFATRLEPWVHPLLVGANFVVYLGAYLCMVMLSAYVIRYLSNMGICLPRGAFYGMAVLIGILLTLLVVSQFTGAVYYIDGNNYYHVGPLYRFTQGCTVLYVAINVWVVLRNRRHLESQDVRILLFFLLAPLMGAVSEMFILEIMLSPILLTMALIVLYISMQVRQEILSSERERELMTSLMLSQIQPHFLFNSLASIEYLCQQDPQEAGITVRAFSKYLRGNLDALSLTQPIPFEKELEHVRVYLSLEKKRFGDRLHVEYDIRTTDFSLPALSLQPIVENAVRHGVTKRDEGGRIGIESWEHGAFFCVSITDNGIGFIPDAYAQDGGVHLGIESVRSRLKSLSDGTLDIHSSPGLGTVAVISIPKGGKAL